MQIVSSTKSLIQKFRYDKWDDLICSMKLFCEARNIDIYI